MIKLVVSGCCGRMGRKIVALAAKDKEFNVVGAIEAGVHPAVGRKLSDVLINPSLSVEVNSNTQIIKDGDVLIEFTNPSATIEHLAFAVKYKKAVVIGTTGLDEQQKQTVRQAGKDIPIIFSPNMSWGVNVVFSLVKEATQKLGSDYIIDIQEAHHIHKKDAPSGTAKRLAELIKQTSAREGEHIKIESVRQGEIIGDHQVRFISSGDAIVIRHSARTRNIFAEGALRAAKFVVQQVPGLYDMQDVISAS